MIDSVIVVNQKRMHDFYRSIMHNNNSVQAQGNIVSELIKKLFQVSERMLFRQNVFSYKFFEMIFHFLHCIKGRNTSEHNGAQIFIAKMIFLYDCRIFDIQSIGSTNFQLLSDSNVRVLEKCLDKVTIRADAFLSLLIDFDNFDDLIRLRLHIEER